MSFHFCLNCKKSYVVKCKRDAARTKFCSRSCGTSFRNAEKAKYHGMSNSRIYKVWIGIKKRCYSLCQDSYKNYGARGIKICERWLDFFNFYADMGDVPFENAQIDRINNDGDYEPNNCRWATPKQNSQNRRTNVFVILKGKKVCLAVACREINIDYYTFKNRRRDRNLTNQETLDSFIISRRR